MPTYEYKCDACGNKFEKFQSMSAAPIKKCPKCGKSKVRRLIGTGAGLIFKGSGFYITDYRDAGYKDKAKAESGEGKPAATDAKSDAKSESKAETKSESKSETKSESKPAAESKSAAKSESKSSSKSEKKK
jgi:putative FmdB family regulatory protein